MEYKSSQNSAEKCTARMSGRSALALSSSIQVLINKHPPPRCNLVPEPARTRLPVQLPVRFPVQLPRDSWCIFLFFLKGAPWLLPVERDWGGTGREPDPGPSQVRSGSFPVQIAPSSGGVEQRRSSRRRSSSQPSEPEGRSRVGLVRILAKRALCSCLAKTLLESL